jgi:Tfp pilus assembly protein PilO
MQDNAAAVPGGMHRMMRCGGENPPMRKAMGMQMEEMRATVGKLRALEAKMETLKSKDDAAAFRAASLEHSKLLTDHLESRLMQMERMMDAK